MPIHPQGQTSHPAPAPSPDRPKREENHRAARNGEPVPGRADATRRRTDGKGAHSPERRQGGSRPRRAREEPQGEGADEHGGNDEHYRQFLERRGVEKNVTSHEHANTDRKTSKSLQNDLRPPERRRSLASPPRARPWRLRGARLRSSPRQSPRGSAPRASRPKRPAPAPRAGDAAPAPGDRARDRRHGERRVHDHLDRGQRHRNRFRPSLVLLDHLAHLVHAPSHQLVDHGTEEIREEQHALDVRQGPPDAQRLVAALSVCTEKALNGASGSDRCEVISSESETGMRPKSRAARKNL